MRSMFRRVLVALVAVLALGAVTVASASAALPEFQQKGKGLEKAVKFTVKSGWGKLESKAGDELKCTGESVTGETHGVNEVANVVIRFTGCNEGGVIGACTSPGAKTEEVVSVSLSGRLGYLSKSETKRVGLLLQPSTGEQIAECTYHGSLKEIFRLKGSIIGRLRPDGEELHNDGKSEETTEFSLEFNKAAGKGEQEWTHFEGEEALHSLELTPWSSPRVLEKAAWATSNSVISGEAMELKA